MPESRLVRALLSGIILGALVLALVIALQIINWLIGDPRWWLVIGLVVVIGALVQWRSDLE